MEPSELHSHFMRGASFRDAFDAACRGDAAHARKAFDLWTAWEARSASDYICSSSDERQAARDYLDATGAESTLALIARIRELEAALAPFASYSKATDPGDWAGDGEIAEQYRDGLRVSIRLSALREAARVSKESADGK